MFNLIRNEFVNNKTASKKKTNDQKTCYFLVQMFSNINTISIR